MVIDSSQHMTRVEVLIYCLYTLSKCIHEYGLTYRFLPAMCTCSLSLSKLLLALNCPHILSIVVFEVHNEQFRKLIVSQYSFIIQFLHNFFYNFFINLAYIKVNVYKLFLKLRFKKTCLRSLLHCKNKIDFFRPVFIPMSIGNSITAYLENFWIFVVLHFYLSTFQFSHS